MKKQTFLLLILIINLSCADSFNIDLQIEKIKNAPESQRLELMNQFKRELILMNQIERENAIGKLKNSSSTPKTSEELPIREKHEFLDSIQHSNLEQHFQTTKEIEQHEHISIPHYTPKVPEAQPQEQIPNRPKQPSEQPQEQIPNIPNQPSEQPQEEIPNTAPNQPSEQPHEEIPNTPNQPLEQPQEQRPPNTPNRPSEEPQEQIPNRPPKQPSEQPKEEIPNTPHHKVDEYKLFNKGGNF